MVKTVLKHKVKWLAPAPLWNTNSNTHSNPSENIFFKPAILRFASDAFMDEYMALLQHCPGWLAVWKARPETWREPMPTPEIASFIPTSETTPLLNVNEPISDFSKQKKIRMLDMNKMRNLPEQTNLTNTGAEPPLEGGSKNNDGEGPLPFKLYQPAHMRYYLVATSLVCKYPGLPDRFIDPGRQEQVSFVVRRLIDPKTDPETDPKTGKINNHDHTICNSKNLHEYDEYAFITTAEGEMWKKIPKTEQNLLIAGEERIPLFGINFNEENGHKRRILSGLIPVGKRETYLAAQKYTEDDKNGLTPPEKNPPDPRRMLFETAVVSPWISLVEQAAFQKEREDARIEIPSEDEEIEEFNLANTSILKASREQIQTASWYILLDFARFLEQYLPNIWRAIQYGSPESITGEKQKIFYRSLKSMQIDFQPISSAVFRSNTHYYYDSDIKMSLTEALAAIRGDFNDEQARKIEKELESIDIDYDRNNAKPDSNGNRWPTFLFPFADPVFTGPLPDIILKLPEDQLEEMDDLDKSLAIIDAFADQLEAALEKPTGPQPETLLAGQPIMDTREAWFVIRCVYERPNCGPFNPPVVSEPTQPFQMAAFFDPDAPTRPIRIPLPVDISPAGLRKFKKNTAFIVSDLLCGKIKQIKKLTFGDLVLSVLPWPFHKSLPNISKPGPCKSGSSNLGMICSLSIPIVTLCALILMMIIVALFDQFFRWIPFLFTCFPIPGFKGKK